MKKSAIYNDIQKCVHCGGCSAVCPQNAISLADEKTFEINENLCKSCYLCTIFCPMNALKPVGRTS